MGALTKPTLLDATLNIFRLPDGALRNCCSRPTCTRTPRPRVHKQARDEAARLGQHGAIRPRTAASCPARATAAAAPLRAHTPQLATPFPARPNTGARARDPARAGADTWQPLPAGPRSAADGANLGSLGQQLGRSSSLSQRDAGEKMACTTHRAVDPHTKWRRHHLRLMRGARENARRARTVRPARGIVLVALFPLSRAQHSAEDARRANGSQGPLQAGGLGARETRRTSRPRRRPPAARRGAWPRRAG